VAFTAEPAQGRAVQIRTKRPDRRWAAGSVNDEYYLAVDGAGVAFFFLLLEPLLLVELCFLCFALVEGVVVPEAGVSAAIGAAVFGISAAMAPAAIPKAKIAEVIKVPDFFMGSPAMV
jgi:hypothetical protein